MVSAAEVRPTASAARPAVLLDAFEDNAPEEHPMLRLVKLTSDALPRSKIIAVVDGRHGGVSIGRDRTFTRRLRLPSMEISKHHANLHCSSRTPIVYYITDTASTHGTYVCRRNRATPLAPGQRSDEDTFVRLSDAKRVSRPHALQHLDLVRLGASTTFEVHLHADAHSCAVCTASTESEISLEPGASAAKRSKPALVPRGTQPVDIHRRKRAKELTSMFRQGPTSTLKEAERASSAQSVPLTSNPAPPLSDSNIGYRMLAEMAGGVRDAPLFQQERLVPRVASGRAGLGSKEMPNVEAYAAHLSQSDAHPADDHGNAATSTQCPR